MSNLCAEQKSIISDYLQTTVWEHIYDNILTDEQRETLKTDKSILFDIEDRLKFFAASIGLHAF